MRITSKCLIGMAALVFFATQAAAAERSTTSSRAEVVTVKKAKKTVRVPVRHEYENVAGFKGQLRDPLYSYAAEPSSVVVPEPMGPRRPVITQWPMPNTVWW